MEANELMGIITDWAEKHDMFVGGGARPVRLSKRKSLILD